MKNFVFILILVTNFTLNSQEKLPYSEIPIAANEYTPGTTASRLIDGLGFRYYWTTEGLKEIDLVYKPNAAARSSEETINHILGLSQVILNATLKVKNGQKQPKMTFVEKRKKTLENLHQASKILRVSNDISQYKMIFGAKELPFWNVINGPIADAIWHVGQVVSFRRSSGNPINPKINHLSGTIKE